MAKKQKEKQEKYTPVKRMTFGEFRGNLIELIPKMLNDETELKVIGPWISVAYNDKISRKYRVSSLYEKYLNSCEACLTESPFKETAEWITIRFVLDLKSEGIELNIVELQKTPDTTTRTIQEVNPKAEIAEQNQRYKFMEKLRNRLLDIFYDYEFTLDNEHLVFTNTDVDLRTDDLYARYNEYKENGSKNPAKKVAKFVESQYDEYMDRGR